MKCHCETAHGFLSIIVFITLLVITLYEAYNCLQRYLEFPKYTSIKLVYQENVDFPSLTFCPIFDEAVKVDVLAVNIIKHCLNKNKHRLIIKLNLKQICFEYFNSFTFKSGPWHSTPRI